MEMLTYPNCRQSIWLAILFILWVVVITLLLSIGGVSFFWRMPLLYLSTIIVLAFGFWKKAMDRSILHYTKLEPKMLAFAFIGTLCTPWVHASICDILPSLDFVDRIVAEMSLLNDQSSHLMSIATGTILCSFIMEILFRGVVLRGLLTEYKAWMSIVIAALIYAVVLGCFTLMPVLGFIDGLWFGWLYVYSRSLWTSIFSSLVLGLMNVTYYFISHEFTLPEQVTLAMEGGVWIINLTVTFFFCIVTSVLYITFKRNSH